MRALVVLLAAGLALTACGQGRHAEGADGPIVVFAAASMTDALEDVAQAFSASHGGTEVLVSFGNSSRLADQILDGAPADVFVSADPADLRRLQEAGAVAVGTAATLATNRLAIAVEPGNPLAITGLADLARPGIVVVLAAEDVPAGRYARQALEAAGIAVSPASLEPDVRAARSKVALGEADAAVVYASDVAVAGADVEGVAIPARFDVQARYPIAVLTGAGAPARDFVDFALAERGQAILADHGFSAP